MEGDGFEEGDGNEATEDEEQYQDDAVLAQPLFGEIGAVLLHLAEAPGALQQTSDKDEGQEHGKRRTHVQAIQAPVFEDVHCESIKKAAGFWMPAAKTGYFPWITRA